MGLKCKMLRWQKGLVASGFGLIAVLALAIGYPENSLTATSNTATQPATLFNKKTTWSDFSQVCSGAARLLGGVLNKRDHLCALKPIRHSAIVLL